MKTLITLLTILIFTNNLWANCGFGKITSYPSSQENISSTDIIVLDGSGIYKGLIELINIDYPVYLESDKYRVLLKTIEKCNGEAGKSQVLLQPSEKLIKGKTYFLRIKNLKDYYTKNQLNTITKKYENISWKVGTSSNSKSPEGIINPTLIKKEAIAFGCGPAVNAIFNLKATNKSTILVKTKLINLTTNSTQIHYLSTNKEGQLKVGRDICYGAFKYEFGHRYKISFSPFEIRNTSNKKGSDWIYFESPYNQLYESITAFKTASINDLDEQRFLEIVQTTNQNNLDKNLGRLLKFDFRLLHKYGHLFKKHNFENIHHKQILSFIPMSSSEKKELAKDGQAAIYLGNEEEIQRYLTILKTNNSDNERVAQSKTEALDRLVYVHEQRVAKAIVSVLETTNGTTSYDNKDISLKYSLIKALSKIHPEFTIFKEVDHENLRLIQNKEYNEEVHKNLKTFFEDVYLLIQQLYGNKLKHTKGDFLIIDRPYEITD